MHAGSVINKWRLAEDLWPNKGINNIYNSVYLLNKTMKEYKLPIHVVNMNEGYTLEIDSSIHIDMIKFDQLNLKDVSSIETLNVANYISQSGSLFLDKDYPWITLYREQYTIKHQKILDQLLDYYQEKDPIIYEGLVQDYERLYGD